MKTSKLVFGMGLAFVVACGGSDDGNGDTNAMTVGMTLGGSGDDGSGGGDGSGSTAAGDDDAPADDGGDGTTGGADGMMDDGADDGAVCDPPCADGEECVAGQCFGRDDDGGSTGGGGGMCGTNVMLTNPACDTCVKDACCDQMQACFGDETVTMPTPCLELNNCIVMNCAMAQDLQMCINENCSDFADQVPTWGAFQQCAGMSCMTECAGG